MNIEQRMRIRFPLALLLAFAVTTSGRTQVPAPISIPIAARSDPAALEAAIPGLACLSSTDVPADTPEGKELRFRFLFTCGRFEPALESLEDWMRHRVTPPGET